MTDLFFHPVGLVGLLKHPLGALPEVGLALRR
jgi:hypothetical protein